MKRNVLKKLLPFVLLIPFCVGIVGYRKAGETVSDAVYYSIQLYSLGWNGAQKSVWLEVARWTAPLVTAAGILAVVRRAWHYIAVRAACLHGDSTVIYGQSEIGRRLRERIPHSVLAEGKPLKCGKEHIIMLADDRETLRFFQRYRKDFSGKKVYLCLKEFDSNLLSDTVSFDEGAEVRFFNIHDVIARDYWKTVRLWENPADNGRARIVIWGFGNLGQRMLHYALLLNLFSKEQQICYHIFGESSLYEASCEGFRTMNGDQILFHETGCKDQWQVLGQADRVIFTEPLRIELLQTLLGRFPSLQIDYYSPGDENIEELIGSEKLHGFGEEARIYSEENIKTDKLYREAKELNHLYVSRYGGEQKLPDDGRQKEKEWNSLDGFTKGSNISAADYAQVLRELKGKAQYTETELAELEHIRWCRYHFLNHWRYGTPENGKNKDPVNRVHKDLCPFSELAKEERQKALITIREEIFDGKQQ